MLANVTSMSKSKAGSVSLRRTADTSDSGHAHQTKGFRWSKLMLRFLLVKVDAKFPWSKLMLRVPLVKVDAN